MEFGRWCKLVAFGCAGLVPALSAFPVQGQTVPNEVAPIQSPLLVLDQEKLFDGSNVAESISQEIERRSLDLAAENRAIEAELVAEELDLTERRATLTPEVFRTLADAFDEKVQRIRTEQDAKTRELQRLREQERQNFLRRISPVLAEIVRERGAVAVLDRRSVFLSAESIDITAEAIARINAFFEEAAPRDPVPAPDAGPRNDPLVPGIAPEVVPNGDGNGD